MNRVLLAGNIVLALALAGVVGWWALGAEAARVRSEGSETTIGLKQLRLRPLVDGEEPRYQLDFGTPMVGPEKLGEATSAALVRLEPPVPIACRWHTSSILEIVPRERLRPASRYAVILAHRQTALDGRRLAAGTRLDFTTDRLALKRIAISRFEPGDQAFVLKFNLPVDPAQLEKALVVLDDESQPLPATVKPLAATDLQGTAFEVSLALQAEKSFRALSVVLAETLTPIDGELPLGRRVTRPVRFLENLLCEGIEAGGGGDIRIDLSHGIVLPEANTIAVEPPVPFQVEVFYWGSDLRLLGDFPAGEVVTVTLAEGFPGKGKWRLARPYRARVRIRDREPELTFVQSGQVLSARAVPELIVRGVNVPRLQVVARSLYPNNVVRLVQRRPWDRWGVENVFGPPQSLEMAVEAAVNEPFVQTIALEKLVGPDARGFHRIEVFDVEGRSPRRSRLLQVTDLGVTVRAAPDAVAVRVHGLAAGDAVAGASVRVLTPTNQALAEGTTDADGIAVLRFRRTASDRVPYLVEVAKDGDAIHVDLDGFRVELTDDGLGGRPYLTEGLEAYVAFDRGAMRPGDEARATVVIRNARGFAPPATRIEAHWYRPDGRRVRTESLEAPGSGLAVVRLGTDASAPTGAWRLEIRDAASGGVIGQQHFQVEAFVPDRIEAEVKAEGPLRLGGEGVVEIRGRWLEGGPAAGRPVKVYVRYDHGDFAPAGFESYAFGREPRGDPPGGRPVIQTVLDAGGTARVRFDLPPETLAEQALSARIVAEVEDPSGRAVRAGLELPVRRADRLLGVTGDADHARVVLVTPEGALHTEPVPVEVSLVRCHWSCRRVDSTDGTYRYVTEAQSVTLERQVIQVEGGRGRVDFRPGVTAEAGWLAVVARAGTAVVQQAVGRRPAAPDRLRVTGPAAPVPPGGEAELLITAPCAGTAFVTLEGTTVHGAQVVPVFPGAVRMRVQVPPDVALPNIHAVVTLTAPQVGASGDAPVWLCGGASIPLAHPERGTAVRIEAPAAIEPGATVRLKVSAPGAHDAVVALVDDGILRLTGHPAPDPLAWFLAARRLDSRGADTGTQLLSGARFLPGDEPGGGGGERLAGPRLEGSTSHLIETVALFEGPISLDEQGAAEVAFAVPASYEGRLRALVIAAGSRVVGGAEAPIVVRAPLGLRIAMPRMLAPGDACRIPVTVRNGTGRAGAVSLALESVGGMEIEAGPEIVGDCIERRPIRIALEPEEVCTVEVAVKAGPTAGSQGFRVCAALGEERRTATAQVAVRPAARYTVERIGLAVDGKAEVALGGRWQGGQAAGRLVLGGAPREQLRPAVEALLAYPYGCVEQTASQGFALLAGGSLLRHLGPGTRGVDVDHLLRVAVDRLFEMQTASGGLSMWSGGTEEYRFGSIYALDFLLEARAAGVAVPEAALERLTDRVAEWLGALDSVSHRAVAGAVLARAGRPVASWLRLLEARTTQLEDRAWLALGLAHLGRKDEAAALLEGEGLQRATERDSGDLLRSPVRERALELRARLAATPDHPRIPVLAAELTDRVLRPQRLNTQEQGQAVLALARYHDAHAVPDRAVRARVRLGETTRAVEAGVELALVLPEGATLALESDGPLYGVLEVAGHRIDAPAPAGRDVQLRRRILDADTGKPAAGFRRGGVYEVVLEGRTARAVDNLLVTDIVPGGFEIENPRLGAAASETFRTQQPDHLEIRDDRVLLFAAQPIRGKFAYAYRMRAVFVGEYARHPFVCEALYEPGFRTEGGGGGAVTIR